MYSNSILSFCEIAFPAYVHVVHFLQLLQDFGIYSPIVSPNMNMSSICFNLNCCCFVGDLAPLIILHVCERVETLGCISSCLPPMTGMSDRGDIKMPKFPCLSISVGCSESSSIPSSISMLPENLDSGHLVDGENSCLTCSEMVTADMLVMLSTTYALTCATVPPVCKISKTTYSEFKESVCPNDSTTSVFLLESIFSSSTSLLLTIVHVDPLSKNMLVVFLFLSLPVTTVTSWIMRRILSPSKSGAWSSSAAAFISSSLVSLLAALTHAPCVVASPESPSFTACCGKDLAWNPFCENCLWLVDPWKEAF